MSFFSSMPFTLYGKALRPLGGRTTRHVHDQACEQVEARFNGIEQDILAIGRVGAEALQTEALDDRRLGPERGEGGVGAAAFRLVIYNQLPTELSINLLGVPGKRSRGSRRLQRR